MLGFIIRNCQNFNDTLALKTLYYSFVRSKLEYGSIIWYPHYDFQKLAIEKVQRKFCKFLYYKVNRVYPDTGYNQNLLYEEFEMPSLYLRGFYTYSETTFAVICLKIV